MGIFEEKEIYTRSELKEAFLRASDPLGAGKREELLGLFGSEYGGNISKKDVRQMLQELKAEKNRLSGKGKEEAEQRIRDLGRITGVKI